MGISASQSAFGLLLLRDHFMIKVCHIITSLNLGGAEIMLYKLLSMINHQRYDSIVISLTTDGPVGKMIRLLGVRVLALGMRRGRLNPLGIWRLAERLRNLRPNIIQTWMYHSDLIGSASAALAGRIPIVWNVRHSNLDRRVNKWTTLGTARICAMISSRVPERIVCNSKAAFEIHAAIGYCAKKICVIPNGFDTDTFCPNPQAKLDIRRQLRINDQSILIGLVGRFDSQKDHLTFVRAAGQLIKEGLNVHFVLCGEGITPHNQKLVKWIREVGCFDFFHLLGPREDIARVIASFDIAASSSCGESFANAIGEAMACEVPCAVTDVGDSSRIVGDLGKIVPAGEPIALAKALRELATMAPEERSEIGKKARKRVIRYFSLAAIVRQYEQMYEEILGLNSLGKL
jgi:glycosyltransferase involved in cell wall biosynthesis